MNDRTIMPNRHVRNRGVAAILAMMFLVIFSSLAAAMAIVAQGNLSTADAHLKVNRALAAAETGMQFIMFRLNEVTANVTTTDGLIDQNNAVDLWNTTRPMLLTALENELHNLTEPVELGNTLEIGPITLGAGDPAFTVAFTPHPIPNEDYDAAYYNREPYLSLAVSNASPLDATWLRVRVEASDGPAGQQVARGIELDFKMDKKIRFAILSKSRVMIGRNVMIEGPIGSRFTDTHLANGHPVQMVSDFRGLDSQLDTSIDQLVGTLINDDMDGDNRINVNDPAETANLSDPADLDINGDGYIDDYDMFLDHFDTNGDLSLSATELDTSNNIVAAQLLTLIDTFGDPSRSGYNDGVIDNDDAYTKIRGDVKLTADLNGWQIGAADPNGNGSGDYKDYFQGAIVSDHSHAPLTFEADDVDVHQFDPTDFDVSLFRNMTAVDSFDTQVNAELALYDPADPLTPQPVGAATEEVPFGSAHPYDFYDRPVYENMTFTDVRIPKGTNALFKNCKFVGVTFVETETDNVDPNFNQAGTQEADGSLKFPGVEVQVGGLPVADTKTISNNVRFDGCTFEGGIVSDASTQFTHVRNKIALTGQTQFVVEASTVLTATQKDLFKRSTLLAPHYSVEMGTFVNPTDPNETVDLSGTIVAGVLDVRGQVTINGSILTTFEPTSSVAPVVGDTSPQFNTTLGYFPSADGDLEAEMPAVGMGMIKIRYDPTLAMPDGILGPIEILPVNMTYTETGKK